MYISENKLRKIIRLKLNKSLTENKDLNFPIKNKEDGDKFRNWVNDNYSEEDIAEIYDGLKSKSLDRSGSFNNAHIKRAWKVFGSEFTASRKSKNSQKFLRAKQNNIVYDLDPRYSSNTLKVKMMPLSKQHTISDRNSDYLGYVYPSKTTEWAKWEQVPALNKFGASRPIAYQNYCWIPSENIPSDYNLPLQGVKPKDYITKVGIFKMGERGKPAKYFSELIKQLTNIFAWLYGTQTRPLVYHPELKRKMFPPSWSIYYGATEKRALTMASKINKGQYTVKYYADRNGYKNKYENFISDVNSVIRDVSKQIKKENIKIT